MEKKNPLISIIIVNYNGANFLPRLLKSIYAQTFKDYEIILVDNGSKDNSIDYIRKEHPVVKLIEYENKGYGAGCNRGVKLASGEIVTFLNEDMYLQLDFLDKMYSKFIEIKKKDKNIGALSCRMVGFDEDPSQSHIAGTRKVDLFGFTYPQYEYKESAFFILSGSPFFTIRGLFNKLGGYSEYIFLYGEDNDLSWRYNILGYKLYVNNDTYIHHYGGGVTGSPGFKWMVSILISQALPMINCYSPLVLVFIFPVYILYVFTITLFLYLKSGLRYEIIDVFIKRIIYLLKNFKGILDFRRYVQKQRVISDWKVFKNMSVVPAFLHKKSWKRV